MVNTHYYYFMITLTFKQTHLFLNVLHLFNYLEMKIMRHKSGKVAKKISCMSLN